MGIRRTLAETELALRNLATSHGMARPIIVENPPPAQRRNEPLRIEQGDYKRSCCFVKYFLPLFCEELSPAPSRIVSGSLSCSPTPTLAGRWGSR